MKRYLSFLLTLVLTLSLCVLPVYAVSNSLDNFQKVNTYTQGQYTDVPFLNTFASNVQTGFEYGIMQGYGNKFGISNNITRIASIIISDRINCIFYNGENNIESSYTGTTQEMYLAYAKDHNIYCNFSDISKTATRAEFAAILSSALPDSALAEKNSIEDNSIADVTTSSTFAAQIYRLYRAGVLNGSDNNGTFYPSTNITRGAACAIATRMINENLRKSITLKVPNVTVNPVGCSSGIQYIITDTSFEYYTNSIGNIEFYGIVGIKNTGTTSIYMADCTFDLEDSSGHLLQTESLISAGPELLLPGETGYFFNGTGSCLLDAGVSTDNGLKLVAQITLKKATGAAATYNVSDTCTREGSYGSFSVTGRIINNTTKDNKYLYIDIVFFDSNGKVLGVAGTSILGLYAGATVSFEWSSLYTNKNITLNKVSKYKVIARENYYQWD